MPAASRHSQRSAPKRRRRGERRKGVFTLAVILALTVFLMLLALVLHVTYLFTLAGKCQQRADIMALAAAPALLDEDMLCDAHGEPAGFQADDFEEAAGTCQRYRRANNRAGSRAFDLDADDVSITPGIVTGAGVGVSATVAFVAADQLPAAMHGHMKTLRVAARSSGMEGNPVGHLIARLFRSENVDLSGVAYATLDDRVIGFRPTATAAAPLVPLAIDAEAWRAERLIDDDHNDINEFWLRLPTGDDANLPANGALLLWGGDGGLTGLARQISQGLYADDLYDSAGVLGPATATSPLTLKGTQSVGGSVAAFLATELAELAQDPYRARRVFPIYDAVSPDGTALRVIGFVSGRVISSTVADGALVVQIEPCFLIHFTAWTVPADHPAAPEPNLYVHKLRLSR